MPRAIATVHIPPDFEKAFLRLPERIRRLATQKDNWFRNDAFDPRLRTRRLKGKLSEYWSYSVNREYRILFRFLNPHEVIYYDIGTHEIYR
jgi:mRNA-degrading endonuclease RelE of RelBE toxin-antitoxin system